MGVTDVAPSITSATSVSVPEGTSTATTVYTAAANDVQGGAVTYSLGGADAAAFTINGSTGAVTFNSSPNFETKSSYSFNVVASDGTLTTSQAVTVSVTDVAPTISSRDQRAACRKARARHDGVHGGGDGSCRAAR